jgi:hypothetical protein
MLRFSMTPLPLFASLALSTLFMSGLVSAADNVAPDGFVALFNGKDLTGWHGSVQINRLLGGPKEEVEREQAKADALMREHWQVVDGVLVNDGKGTNLATIQHFKNFELLVDWKINPKGDSGIYLRGIPQVQIWDSRTLNEKQFAREKDKGSGALWNNKRLDDKIPLAFADKEPGEWNTFRITMIGDKVSVKLNGVLVVDDVTLDNLWEPGQPVPAAGPIELQYHPNQDGVADNLYFKNIYIRELP